MSVQLKIVIYQLVLRYFGNTNRTNKPDGTLLENGCGKFRDVSVVALQSLRELGVTHIWLTGCLRQATLTDYPDLGLPADDPDIVKGVAGSFYAVRDYFDVCPDYAVEPARRMEEFRELLLRIHAAGFKVLIDFVPNHVARSYHSIVRPEMDFGTGDEVRQFYARDNSFFYLVDPPGQRLQLTHPAEWQPAGVTFDGRFEPEDGSRPERLPKATGNAWKRGTTASPSEHDWYEAIKLNYGFNYVTEVGEYEPVPRTWQVMDQVLQFWQELGVDGFRCDMAQLIPAEAWRWLIVRSRDASRNAATYFLAEAYVGSSPYDPVKSNDELLAAGFDSIYHDQAYNRLRDVYRGGLLSAYSEEMGALSGAEWAGACEYLENHDKPRVPAALRSGGFGSLRANYQLAPLAFLYSQGPVLLLNGQEVGEPGSAGVRAGYAGDDGRTTFFDYWCMPVFADWVNDGAFDGGLLSEEQRALRRYFAQLLGLCQHPAVRGRGYWGLRYWNLPSRFSDCPEGLYSFARFEPGSGEMVVVVANFAPGQGVSGRVRIPLELATAAGLREHVVIRTVLSSDAVQDQIVSELPCRAFIEDGVRVDVCDQGAIVLFVR